MKPLKGRSDRKIRFAPESGPLGRHADIPGSPGKFHRPDWHAIPIQTGSIQDNVQTILVFPILGMLI